MVAPANLACAVVTMRLSDIRRCTSPSDARSLIAASCGAPRGVLQELGRQTRATMEKVFALEELLRQEEEEHQERLEALRSEHRVEKRRGKLRLLARYAPHGAAAREALRCEAALPPESTEAGRSWAETRGLPPSADLSRPASIAAQSYDFSTVTPSSTGAPPWTTVITAGGFSPTSRQPSPQQSPSEPSRAPAPSLSPTLAPAKTEAKLHPSASAEVRPPLTASLPRPEGIRSEGGHHYVLPASPGFCREVSFSPLLRSVAAPQLRAEASRPARPASPMPLPSYAQAMPKTLEEKKLLRLALKRYREDLQAQICNAEEAVGQYPKSSVQAMPAS
eukprot:s1416_g5.t1